MVGEGFERLAGSDLDGLRFAADDRTLVGVDGPKKTLTRVCPCEESVTFEGPEATYRISALSGCNTHSCAPGLSAFRTASGTR